MGQKTRWNRKVYILNHFFLLLFLSNGIYDPEKKEDKPYEADRLDTFPKEIHFTWKQNKKEKKAYVNEQATC